MDFLTKVELRRSFSKAVRKVGGQERSHPQSPQTLRKKRKGAILVLRVLVYIVYKKSVVFSYSLLNIILFDEMVVYVKKGVTHLDVLS